MAEHNEATLSAILERKYCAPEWAYLPQVRNGTGFLKSPRTADAIAMSLWPSRGLELHGFEMKVSRSDWLHELKNPQKAEDIALFCDRWWLVVAEEGIVQDGELPGPWGLYVAKGSKLYCKKTADKLTAEPIDKLFLAAILRRVNESVQDTVFMKAQYEKGKKEGERLMKNQYEGDIARAIRERDSFKDTIEKFEGACGIKVSEFSWQKPEVLGKAFRRAVAIESDMGYQMKRLKEIRDSLTKIIEANPPEESEFM